MAVRHSGHPHLPPSPSHCHTSHSLHSHHVKVWFSVLSHQQHQWRYMVHVYRVLLAFSHKLWDRRNIVMTPFFPPPSTVCSEPLQLSMSSHRLRGQVISMTVYTCTPPHSRLTFHPVYYSGCTHLDFMYIHTRNTQTPDSNSNVPQYML